jgi:hypothetical protein
VGGRSLADGNGNTDRFLFLQITFSDKKREANITAKSQEEVTKVAEVIIKFIIIIKG